MLCYDFLKIYSGRKDWSHTWMLATTTRLNIPIFRIFTFTHAFTKISINCWTNQSRICPCYSMNMEEHLSARFSTMFATVKSWHLIALPLNGNSGCVMYPHNISWHWNYKYQNDIGMMQLELFDWFLKIIGITHMIQKSSSVSTRLEELSDRTCKYI